MDEVLKLKLELSPCLPNLENSKNQKYFTIMIDKAIQGVVFSFLSDQIKQKKCPDFSECIINAHNYEIDRDENDVRQNSDIYYKLAMGRIKLEFLDGEIIVDRLYNNNIVGTRDAATVLKITKLHSNIGLDHISDFIQVCIERREKKNTLNSIRVKTFDEAVNDWSCGHQIKKRSKESIYIPDKDLDSIIKDMTNFFESKDEYMRLGIPHKRNYLLYGPPGTGKTSTITALASHFNLSISTLVLGPLIKDSNIINAMSYMRSDSIMVMEDIDSIIHAAGQRELANTKLTFSTLLNILDGHIRREGSVVFMTTNFKEKISGVLSRPGRLDYQLEFKKMRLPEIKKMVRNFFNEIEEKEIIEISDLINSIKPIPSTASLQKFLFHIIQQKNGVTTLKTVKENLDKLDEIISLEIERECIDTGSALVM